MCANGPIIARGAILRETGWGLRGLLGLGVVGPVGWVASHGGGKRRLTEGAKECGGGYIHHPPTRSPYPLIRSVRSLCRSARHDTCTGSRACIAPCTRLALLRQNRSIWSFVRHYLPSSPLASARPAMCAPLLRLRCPPVSCRLCFAANYKSKCISLTL